MGQATTTVIWGLSGVCVIRDEDIDMYGKDYATWNRWATTCRNRRKAHVQVQSARATPLVCTG